MTKRYNQDQLKEFIDKRVDKILAEENSSKYHHEVKMNSMVDDGGSLNGSDPSSVKMNARDSQQGPKAGGFVKVDGGKKVESSAHPSKDSGEPFDESGEPVDMNKMDKTDENAGAKTYVEAGGDAHSSQETNKGLKTAKFSETAKNVDEKAEKIADALEISENMKFKNKRELYDFIQEQAKKIKDLL